MELRAFVCGWDCDLGGIARVLHAVHVLLRTWDVIYSTRYGEPAQPPARSNTPPEAAMIHHHPDGSTRKHARFQEFLQPHDRKTKAPTSATGSDQKSPAPKSTGPDPAQAPARAREQLYAPPFVAVPHTRNIAVHCSHALIRRIAETGKNKREKF